jgi:serine/threonine-protein kinase
MDPKRWQQIEQLYQAALEREPGERPAFLDEACQSDDELRREMESLLARSESSPQALPRRPAWQAVTKPLGDSTATQPSVAAPVDFPPGTILAQRYRIVNLLGRGGMGEVYRADDLLLGQPVALKFLPRAASSDADLLARFRNEVRMARQVSHPNVCRVYDIGAADGLTYLSMEYVDGEDLGSLLRRIGKLPQEKALEVTRKLCAGLAAAHEKGVIHRDLKPANIMLDGKGHVRITDFGLAGVAEQIRDLGSGTPAYMAPEQRAGKEVTQRSDIYALGIVLHELFTGTRPSRETRNTELDPAVERVILRCLEENPPMRWASALSVAAALPGGDPLAAALAAGETPSPEMLVASRQVKGIRMSAAVGCLLAVIAGLPVVTVLSGKTNLVERARLRISPDALAQRAVDLLRRFEYSPSIDRAYGFAYAVDTLHYLEVERSEAGPWARTAAGHPSPIVFWYRESPRYLESTSPFSVPPGLVSMTNPPRNAPGMVGLTLDPDGKLLSFHGVPLAVEESEPPQSQNPDAAQLFAAAGIDLTRFAPVRPMLVPPVAFDTWNAWMGFLKSDPTVHLRVEAAFWRGRLVYLETTGNWSRPSRAPSPPLTLRERVGQTITIFAFLTILIGSALLARLNVISNRGDRKGALRLAAFVFGVKMLLWILGGSHVPTFWEVGRLVMGLGMAAYAAGLMWVLYLALEPFVRRRWPQVIISWSRLLAGRFRDPEVGAHVLIGTTLGVGLTLIGQVGMLWNGGVRLSTLYGVPSLTPLLGEQHVGRYILFLVDDSIRATLILLFLLFTLRLIVRRGWLAVCFCTALTTVLGGATSSGDPVVTGITVSALVLLNLIILMRFGEVALMSAFMTCRMLTELPITTDFSAWYFGTTVMALLAVLALAAYGYYTAAAGRSWLRDAVSEA